MNLWETIQIAWEGIAINKVRSFLTMLGIIIGVGTVVGLISLVITNLPELRVSLKLCIIAPTSRDFHHSRPGHRLKVLGRIIPPHQIEPALLLKALIDESPGTVLLPIDLTLAVIGATTGAV